MSETDPFGEPLRLAVVGHVNTGKTSLIATLARRTDLAIDDGRTTVRVEEIRFSSAGDDLLVLVDTPGFELLSEIRDELKRRDHEAASGVDQLDVLEQFVQDARELKRSDFELDLRALEAALGADLILYVVDVTQAPHERLRDELALLVRTARPVVAILNFTAEEETWEEDWRDVFRREKVHTQVAFDVMVADPSAEDELYRALLAVIPRERHVAIERLQGAHRTALDQARERVVSAAADLLLDLATLQESRSRKAPGEPEKDVREALKRRVAAREERGLRDIGRAHGFVGDEVTADGRSDSSWILAADPFDPQTIRELGPGLATLAAGGAAVGATIDLFVGGLSFGTGALIGGVAGLLSGAVRAGVEVRRRGQLVIAEIQPALLWVFLSRVVACHEEYQIRTHARRDSVELGPSIAAGLGERKEAGRVVDLLKTARRELTEGVSDRRRRESQIAVEEALGPLLS